MKTNKKWLPATSRNLCVVCLHFLFDEELFSGIHYKMYFRCLETMLRILCFVKLFICRRRFGGKHAQFIDRSTTSQDENSDGSDGSWRSWRALGTLLMVGGVLYNSEDINKQNESSPGTPAEASGTEGRRREVRDASGRFA